MDTTPIDGPRTETRAIAFGNQTSIGLVYCVAIHPFLFLKLLGYVIMELYVETFTGQSRSAAEYR